MKCLNCGTEYTGSFCPACGVSAPVQTNQVTSVGGWIGWLLLMCFLPGIGTIIMLCASNDESAKNLAKAQLIFMGVSIALTIIGCIIISALGIGSLALLTDALSDY